MPARTATITLDGTPYTVHAFNIGELERITQSGNNAWAVLRIAMERADPKPINVETIAPTLDEVKTAFEVLLTLAGLQKPEGNPLQASGDPVAA